MRLMSMYTAIRYSVCSVSLWQDGAKLCARILSSEDTVILLAQQMVAMAQYYRFDGWLVNIENPINVRYTFLSSTRVH